MKTVLLSILILSLLSCHKSNPIPEPESNYFNPMDLAKLSLDSTQIPEDFYLYSEYFTKPISKDEQIYQEWRLNVNTNGIELLEDTIYEITKPFGASSRQKWDRVYNSVSKDIIEIEIAICDTEELLEETTHYYTQEAFAGVFVQTSVPLFGEKSWIPSEEQTYGSFTVMFVRYNVFIRLFVGTRGDTNEPKNITEELAKKLESRIKAGAIVNSEYQAHWDMHKSFVTAVLICNQHPLTKDL